MADRNDAGTEDGGGVSARLVQRLRDDDRELTDWLFDAALPLWWSRGADQAAGGFQELLDLTGAPVAAPRRARVQARQIYVYATAGGMGWGGPWREAMAHGLDYFIARYLRPDGLVRASVSPDGAPLDDGPVLYDQAFGLLALSAAHAADPATGAQDRARALLASVETHFAVDGPGLRSGDSARPYQSNPHMHLFEAALAWMACDSSPVWRDLAERVASLAMTRFVDASSGGLREFFDSGWDPAPGVDGTIMEPGHQFEWAWLLYRWGRTTDDARAVAVADRLFEIGVGSGIDHARGVAINALDDRFAPLDDSARLWPQTERIKAAVLAAEASPRDRERYLTEVVDGVAGLKRYMLPNGTWRDKLTADDCFIEEPAPASSLYHIIGAITEVTRATKFALEPQAPKPTGHGL